MRKHHTVRENALATCIIAPDKIFRVCFQCYLAGIKGHTKSPHKQAHLQFSFWQYGMQYFLVWLGLSAAGGWAVRAAQLYHLRWYAPRVGLTRWGAGLRPRPYARYGLWPPRYLPLQAHACWQIRGRRSTCRNPAPLLDLRGEFF